MFWVQNLGFLMVNGFSMFFFGVFWGADDDFNWCSGFIGPVFVSFFGVPLRFMFKLFSRSFSLGRPKGFRWAEFPSKDLARRNLERSEYLSDLDL